MSSISSVCICGGGALGHVCAGIFASRGYNVSILSGHPQNWQENITVIDPLNKEYTGIIKTISANPAELIPLADIVLLCVPGFLIKKTLEDIRPHLLPQTIIGTVVSSTGFFFIAHSVLDSGTPLFGFQRVPYISRVSEYGHKASLLGYKKCLNVAIENISNPLHFCNELSNMFSTPIRLLNNFYEASLTNSNPILHTGRLYSMWGGEKGEEPVPKPIYFYSDWTVEASEILIAMDVEFRKILDVLSISSDVVPSILEYYESYDAESLTNKIKSIPAFKSILAPMKWTEKGWVPDYDSRYFTEDFPFGLYFIKHLAEKYKIQTPMIDKVYSWGMSKLK